MAQKIRSNQRNFTRMAFSTRAEVDFGGELVCGEVHDISMNGLYMKSDADVAVGDACEVRIFLGDADPLVMHALSNVVRRDAHGFALAFNGFYCDSASNLKHVILLNADDRRQAEEELRKSPNLTLV